MRLPSRQSRFKNKVLCTSRGLHLQSFPILQQRSCQLKLAVLALALWRPRFRPSQYLKLLRVFRPLWKPSRQLCNSPLRWHILRLLSQPLLSLASLPLPQKHRLWPWVQFPTFKILCWPPTQVPGSTNTVIATATVTEQLPVVTVQPPTRCNVRGAFSVPFRATIIDTLPYDETTTPHDCYLRCQANTNCKSFFYKYREPCNLSNALFQRNGYVSEDPNYFYTFNNRDCPNAAVWGRLVKGGLNFVTRPASKW